MKTGFFTSEFFTTILGAVATIVGSPVIAPLTAVSYVLERTLLKKAEKPETPLKKGFYTPEFWATFLITNASMFIPDFPKEAFYPVIVYIFSQFILKRK